MEDNKMINFLESKYLIVEPRILSLGIPVKSGTLSNLTKDF